MYEDNITSKQQVKSPRRVADNNNIWAPQGN